MKSHLSDSSREWIDEAMKHNSAHDGEQWMRQRTREAHQAFDRLPLWDFSNVDGYGNLVRHEQSVYCLPEALVRSAS